MKTRRILAALLAYIYIYDYSSTECMGITGRNKL